MSLDPIIKIDADDLRARMVATLNVGVDPESDLWAEDSPGSIWADMVGPVAQVLDELYDLVATVVVAQSIPTTAYGDALDEWANTFGLERKDEAPAGGLLRFMGDEGTVVPVGTRAATLQPTEDADPVEFITVEGGTIGEAGVLDLVAEAVRPGAAANVAAGTVTQMISPVNATVTNLDRMTSGADLESDEALSKRLADEIAGGAGGSNQAHLRKIALEEPGVGFATVEPRWDGPGTARVMIRDVNNDPASPTLIDRVQARLDPEPKGHGLGEAMVDLEVTVDTPDLFAVALGATLVHDPGFSLDGEDGSRATRGEIAAAVAEYLDGLEVGEDVVRAKVIAAIVSVDGVADVTGLEINSNSTTNVEVPAGELAQLSSTTLT